MNLAPAPGLRRFALVILTFGLTAFSSVTAQYSFTDLTGLGGDLVSLSPDGATIYGSSDSPGFGEPLYYRNGQTMILPLGTDGNGIARGAASDGTIVGQVRVGNGETFGQAAVWQNGNLSLLERAGGNFADARLKLCTQSARFPPCAGRIRGRRHGLHEHYRVRSAGRLAGEL